MQTIQAVYAAGRESEPNTFSLLKSICYMLSGGSGIDQNVYSSAIAERVSVFSVPMGTSELLRIV